MKYPILNVLSLSLLYILCTAAQAGLYRWVDEQGNIHYSDSVPPHMSQSGHVELDELGNTVNQVAAAKSPEQIAEEKWLAELEEKLRLKKAQQKRKDELLLNSYTTIEQFDRFYEKRFTVLTQERSQMEALRAKLNGELERLQHEYQNSQGTAKERLASFIETNRQNTAAYEQAIEQNLLEEQAMREEAKELRVRFLHLLKNSPQTQSAQDE